MTPAITFTSPALGWMTANLMGPPAQRRHNALMHTRNGGRTWTSFNLPYPVASSPVFHGQTGLFAVNPFSNNHVILLHSKDGGIHWSNPVVMSIATNSLIPFQLVHDDASP